MNIETASIGSLADAIDYFRDTMAEHPERELLDAYRATRAGAPLRYPMIALNHLHDPSDTFVPSDEPAFRGVDMPPGLEAEFAREIVGKLEPLKLLNPVSRSFGLGVGPGTMCASFGQELHPEAHWAPRAPKTMREVLEAGVPDPETSGLLPGIRARIRQIKDLTPPDFKIALPDQQGPFNLAHMILGNEAFTAPYTDPDAFRACMEIITEFRIRVRRTLMSWIGPDRLVPWFWSDNVVCECSCNLISPQMYEEHVLPHDRRLEQDMGSIAIHPCSGPHVFRVTLKNFPNAVYTEAGSIDKTAAGSIAVDEALREIAGRPIVLGVGQEPPPGREYESIREHLDLYPSHPRMTFAYTIMHMRKKDRPRIRDMHRRLDEYWEGLGVRGQGSESGVGSRESGVGSQGPDA